MADANNVVCVLSLLNRDEYPDADHPKVQRVLGIDPQQYRWPSSLWPFRSLIRETVASFKPTVIITNSATTLIATFAANVRVPVIKVFQSFGDAWTSRKLTSRLYLSAQRVALRDLKGPIVAVSAEMATALSTTFGLDRSIVDVIPNSVDINAFAFHQRGAFAAPTIVTLGTLSEVKRPRLAIAGFAELVRQYPGARMTVIGNGPLRNELESLAVKLGVLDQVDFLGTRGDVPALLKCGHVLWHLSRSEGLPLACLEAMATGLPIVGANVRGIREVVIPGQTGFLVDAEDPGAIASATVRIIESHERFQHMSTAARTFVADNFSEERMADRYTRVIRQCA
jgi:glycosyltransferase involved in cell wall biosynthesis